MEGREGDVRELKSIASKGRMSKTNVGIKVLVQEELGCGQRSGKVWLYHCHPPPLSPPSHVCA